MDECLSEVAGECVSTSFVDTWPWWMGVRPELGARAWWAGFCCSLKGRGAMNDVGNIGSIYAAPLFLNDAPRLSSRTVGTANPSVDTVEISPTARALANAVERSSLRIARTHAIRAEIESGTFETPKRIAGTVARLLDVIA